MTNWTNLLLQDGISTNYPIKVNEFIYQNELLATEIENAIEDDTYLNTNLDNYMRGNSFTKNINGSSLTGQDGFKFTNMLNTTLLPGIALPDQDYITYNQAKTIWDLKISDIVPVPGLDIANSYLRASPGSPIKFKTFDYAAADPILDAQSSTYYVSSYDRTYYFDFNITSNSLRIDNLVGIYTRPKNGDRLRLIMRNCAAKKGICDKQIGILGDTTDITFGSTYTSAIYDLIAIELAQQNITWFLTNVILGEI